MRLLRLSLEVYLKVELESMTHGQLLLADLLRFPIDPRKFDSVSITISGTSKPSTDSTKDGESG